MASACLLIFGMMATLLTAVLTMAVPSSNGLRKFDYVWLPVVFGCLAAGGLGTGLVEWLPAVESWLLRLGLASWLLFLPIGLAHHRTFLEPFTIRDLWGGRTWRPGLVRLCCPLSLALVLPLGGLANGFLARRSLDRDRVLRLWWECFGGRHDPL